MDPEKIHDRFVFLGRILGSNFVTRWLTGLMFGFRDSMLKQNVLGTEYRNPIGLGAGFDKNAQLIRLMPYVGFGFVEVGSITGEPCEGNPKPRLWRMPKSESLVVYYGLMNDGAEAISKRLDKLSHEGRFALPVGISVAKTNCEECADDAKGIADYAKAYKHFLTIGDYFTVNISCPNAFGGQPFVDSERLGALLTELDKYYVEGKPVFVKLSPDLTDKQLMDIIVTCDKHKIDGFVCTNLTKSRDNDGIKDANVPDKGGFSGKLVQGLSDALIEKVYQATKGKKVIIGCGGVFTAEDAYRKIRKGASLIHLVTGMIFGGPQAISEINRGLVKLLKRDGFKNISEAIGVDSK